ncbi:MAG: hypothetical protein RL291_997 [Pseudomonadota bacterium]|jgi:hypothetical protein
MNAIQILERARRLGVSLFVAGDRVRMRGPAEALAQIKPEIAASKAEVMAQLVALGGSLTDTDGPGTLPCAPRLMPDDVRAHRAELISLIEALAALEGWQRELLDNVLERAIRGPLSDLMPNLHHFRERLDGARAEEKTRKATAARAWRMEGFDDRRR